MAQDPSYSDDIRHLSLRGQVLDLSVPRVMGILNTTPDSFSDGGEFNSKELAIRHAEEMIGEGADIIDVGGESTRPGSDPVSDQEERSRVIPVLETLVPRYPHTLFSIDTTKYDVARAALDCGVHIINDVSGLQKEPRLADLAAEYDAGLVIMHSKGDPKTMQKDPSYENVVREVGHFLEQQASLARRRGAEHIILDPGFGFGKTLQHNLALLAHLDSLVKRGYPVLVGASRKSMIGQILGDRPVDERLIGTVAAHYEAMTRGAKILRVHDVREAKDSILVYTAIHGSLS